MQAEGNDSAAGDDGAGVCQRVEIAEAASGPVGERDADEGESGKNHCQAGEQAFFQSEKTERPGKNMVRREKAPRVGEDADEAGEEHHLISEEDDKSGEVEGVQIEVDSANDDGTGKQPGKKRTAHQEEKRAGVGQEPAGREEQHEAEVSPAIAPTAQMRRTGAAVLVQRDGNLLDTETAEGSFDDHLAREFHPGGAEIHFLEGVLRERAEAAVKIMRGAAEEQSADECESGIADPAVFPRHGAGDDFAAACGHAAAHDEIGTGAEFFDERLDLAEIVTAVGVAHDEIFSPGGFHPVAQGVAVAFFGNIDNPGTKLAGDVLRAVGAAIVRDENFAIHARCDQSALSRGDAIGKRLGLVEAGHDDRDFGIFLRRHEQCCDAMVLRLSKPLRHGSWLRGIGGVGLRSGRLADAPREARRQ